MKTKTIKRNIQASHTHTHTHTNTTTTTATFFLGDVVGWGREGGGGGLLQSFNMCVCFNQFFHISIFFQRMISV